MQIRVFLSDHIALEGVDIMADFNQALSLLSDDSVSYIHSLHTLEHIENFLPLMKELWRVSQKDAQIEIVVPHISNALAYSDSAHVRFYTMFYFVSPED